LLLTAIKVEAVAEQTSIVDFKVESVELADLASLTNQNLAADNSTVGGGAAGSNFGNSIGRHLLYAASTANLKRQARAQILLCTFSAIWLVYIVAINYAASALAWSVALTCLMLSSLVRLLDLNQEIKYRLVGYIERSENEKADIDIAELAAITLVVSSAVLTAIALLIQYQFIAVHAPLVKRQVVDIELVSPQDATNNGELLPATSAAATTLKRSADLMTLPSENLFGKPQEQVEKTKPLAKKRIARAGKMDKPVRKIQKREKPVGETAADSAATNNVAAALESSTLATAKTPITFKAPSTWKTVVVCQDKDKSVDFATWSATAPTSERSSDKASQAAPVEMVESIDNDGSKNVRPSQSGGRSAGGIGAASDLHTYLKLLNKRVKYFWTPPSGLDRLAIIEFRIKADGTLIRTKAMPHEGKIDAEAEAAAIAAISRAFPFRPLPKEVAAGYLDVRYTFNYRFKQIEGVKNPD